MDIDSHIFDNCYFREVIDDRRYEEDKESKIVFMKRANGTKKRVLNMVIDITGFTVNNRGSKQQRHYLAEIQMNGAPTV